MQNHERSTTPHRTRTPRLGIGTETSERRVSAGDASLPSPMNAAVVQLTDEVYERRRLSDAGVDSGSLMIRLTPANTQLVPLNRTAGYPVAGEYHFVVNGLFYVLTKQNAPTRSLPGGRCYVGSFSELDALSFGTRHTLDQYRHIYRQYIL